MSTEFNALVDELDALRKAFPGADPGALHGRLPRPLVVELPRLLRRREWLGKAAAAGTLNGPEVARIEVELSLAFDRLRRMK